MRKNVNALSIGVKNRHPSFLYIRVTLHVPQKGSLVYCTSVYLLTRAQTRLVSFLLSIKTALNNLVKIDML